MALTPNPTLKATPQVRNPQQDAEEEAHTRIAAVLQPITIKTTQAWAIIRTPMVGRALVPEPAPVVDEEVVVAVEAEGLASLE